MGRAKVWGNPAIVQRIKFRLPGTGMSKLEQLTSLVSKGSAWGSERQGEAGEEEQRGPPP